MDLSLDTIPNIVEELGKISGVPLPKEQEKPKNPRHETRVVHSQTLFPNTSFMVKANTIIKILKGLAVDPRTKFVPTREDCHRYFYTDGKKLWKRATALNIKKQAMLRDVIANSTSPEIEPTREILFRHLTVLCGVLCYRHLDNSIPTPCDDPVEIKAGDYSIRMSLDEAEELMSCDNPDCKYFVDYEEQELDYDLYTDHVCESCEQQHETGDQ